MAKKPPGTVLEFVRRFAPDPRLRAATDQELLQRFLAARDGAAFEVLLRRHAGLVRDVCRGVLADAADVDDAFQATFLVLAQKAGAIRQTASLASWLHGVAYRTALKARAAAARRRKHEGRVPAREAVDLESPTWQEVRAVVHEELAGIADRYRGPLVVCYLEGRPQDEAAALCGLTKATLKRRLERGRALLRERLVRRGLGPGAALLATAWPGAEAVGARTVVRATVAAAGALAAGGPASGLVPARVLALIEGREKVMVFTTVKGITAWLLVAAILGGVVALATIPLRAAAPAGRPAGAVGMKARQNPRPVVVREDGIVHRLAWGGGTTLAAVTLNHDLVALADDAGTMLPSSTVKLYDAATGELRRALGEEKATAVTGLAFAPGGQAAAVTVLQSPDGPPKSGDLSRAEVRLVDPATWGVTDRAELAGGAWALAFAPDGSRLAVGGRGPDGKGTVSPYVKAWDVRAGKLGGAAREMRGGGRRVTCLAFSPGGKHLVTGDEDGTVNLFDALTGEPIRAFTGHGAWVSGVGFTADGQTLVSGGGDRTVRAWDVGSGKLQRTLDGAGGPITALAFAPDAGHFATAGRTGDRADGKVRVLLWDTASWEARPVTPEPTAGVEALAFSPDGRFLALGAGLWPTLGGPEGRGAGRLQTPGELRVYPVK